MMTDTRRKRLKRKKNWVWEIREQKKKRFAVVMLFVMLILMSLLCRLKNIGADMSE